MNFTIENHTPFGDKFLNPTCRHKSLVTLMTNVDGKPVMNVSCGGCLLFMQRNQAVNGQLGGSAV